MDQQPVAIVTGAGRGIGAATARHLAKRGFALVLMSPSDSAARVAAELGGVAISGSVCTSDDLERLVTLALDTYGRIDAVVTGTGHPGWGGTPLKSLLDYHEDDHLLDIPDCAWHEALESLVLPAVRMARLVTPHMCRQRSGSLVNLSGLGAAAPATKYPFGAMIRHSLDGFSQIYTAHYARFGIRMNNVLPGFLDNMEWSSELLETIPARRPGKLDEVAAAIAFLASGESGYITGQNLLVDGGAVRRL